MKKMEFERAVIAVIDTESMDELVALAGTCNTKNNRPTNQQGPQFKPHR